MVVDNGRERPRWAITFKGISDLNQVAPGIALVESEGDTVASRMDVVDKPDAVVVAMIDCSLRPNEFGLCSVVHTDTFISAEVVVAGQWKSLRTVAI